MPEQHDVFICHASEDKESIVRPLAEQLRSHHVEVWYDQFSLSVGDSLREAIDRDPRSSRFGIVVISPAFFSKPWTQRELNGLVAREMGCFNRRGRIKWTLHLRHLLTKSARRTVKKLGLTESAERIAEAFIEWDFVGAYDEMERSRSRRIVRSKSG